MSSPALGASEQQQGFVSHATGNQFTSADALDVFAVLANQDRLTDCLEVANCLATARLVCRGLRKFVDGGLRHVKLVLTADQANTLAREQILAALLRRWDRCVEVIVELKDENWGEHSSAIQAMPLWLFAGVSSDTLARIHIFELCTRYVQPERPSYVPLVSALAARLPSLRRLDLSGCFGKGWEQPEAICTCIHSLFYIDLVASCPRLETLALPWAAHLPGVEALAGSLVRLRVADDGIGALPPEALRSISRLEHLRELSLMGLMVEGQDSQEDDDSTGSQLLHMLDSLPPSVELLELDEVYCGEDDLYIRFSFRGGRLQSVDVKDGRINCRPLQVFAWALLRCRAAGEGVGADPQQLRPSLRIREVLIGEYDKPINTVELGLLRERFHSAALDAISFKSLSRGDPRTMARCAGIVGGFGLPRELRDYDGCGLKPLQLGRADASSGLAEARAASAAAAARTAEVVAHEGSTEGAAGTCAGSAGAPAAAAAAPSRHGEDSGQTGGPAALALETAGYEDLVRVVAERLWADTDTSGTAGDQGPGAASTTTGGRELGRILLLHRPRFEAAEWGGVKEAVAAELEQGRAATLGSLWTTNLPPVRWPLADTRLALAGTRLALAVCKDSGAAVELMAFVSLREGIQATRLRAGAVKSALHQVLLELWHDSATSKTMSQGRRLERLVELMVGAGWWYREHD